MSAISIVAACDTHFAQHARVMLQSVLDSNPSSTFHFYFLTPKHFPNKQLLMEAQNSQCEIRLVDLPSQDLTDLKVTHHVSEAAYYRLLMGRVLPSDLHRVLYLDCDIIVKADIEPLWQTELQENVIAAAADDIVDRDLTIKRRLGLPEITTYFNSGVMLVDLARWRAEAVGERVLNICRKDSDIITYWDQCGLNAYFRGRFKLLDSKWNLQSTAFSRGGDIRCIGDGAAIVHFTTRSKPWDDDCQHPLLGLYLETLRRTPCYSPLKEARRRLKRVLKRRLESILPAVRVMRSFLQ